MRKNNNNYQKWLKKAEEDEIAGVALLQNQHIPAAPICFHFHQMAEKLLKALLVFYEKDFPKVHDLVVLATLCRPFNFDVDSYQKEIEFLNRFYIETRYPGDYSEFSQREAEEALEAAMRVKEFVIGNLKKSS